MLREGEQTTNQKFSHVISIIDLATCLLALSWASLELTILKNWDRYSSVTSTFFSFDSQLSDLRR
jgi:hypothetical protein